MAQSSEKDPWSCGDQRRSKIEVGKKLVADEDDSWGRWKKGDVGIVERQLDMNNAFSGYAVKWVTGKNKNNSGWIHTSCSMPHNQKS